MKRAFLIFLLLAFSTALYAADQGAQKELLVGPEAILWCADLTPVPDEDSSEFQDGFVIFNYDDDLGVLMGTIKLKGAEPYTDYPVRLIQGGGGDCFVVDAILSTNKVGNGVVHIEELGVATAAQVIIDTGDLYVNPTWRATDIFYFWP